MTNEDNKVRIKLERHLWPDEIAERKAKRKKTIIRVLIVIGVIIGLIASFIGGFVGGVRTPNSIVESRPASPLQKIETVMETMKYKWYFGAIDPDAEQKLIDRALYGMTNSEEDPHTTYMSAEEIEAFTSNLNQNFVGIGVQFMSDEGLNIVDRVFHHSPAEEAGMLAGDILLEADGVSLEGMDSDEVVNVVRGEEGTKVTIKVNRQGEIVTMDIIRGQVNASCYGEMLDDKVGYLEIYQFGENTDREVEEYMNAMAKKGMSQLIIDLRGNGGGYLNVLCGIADCFLEKGTLVIQQEYPNGSVDQSFTDGTPVPGVENIVILVNGTTASASEVLTLALKEQRENVTIVGEQTYGKGTVQVSQMLSDGSALKVTTSKWLSPNGVWLNGEGIEPDVVVEVPPVLKMVYTEFEETFEYDQVDYVIETVQQALDYLGYSVSRTDGYFDKGTETAVKQFQQDHELEPTGKIDTRTYTVALSAVRRAWNLDRTMDNQFMEAYRIAKGE